MKRFTYPLVAALMLTVTTATAYPGSGEESKAALHYLLRGTQGIEGKVMLGNNVEEKALALSDDAALFVMVRPLSDDPQSPPLAVVKIDGLKDKKFPVSFRIGPENLMISEDQPFKGPFTIKAKLSRTGDAISSPGDLVGYLAPKEGIKDGAKNVEVVLSEIIGGEAPTSQHNPHAAPATTSPHGSSGNQAITGTVDLPKNLVAQFGGFKASDALFIIAYKKGETQPYAVTKIDNLQNRKFPIPFALGPQDIMLGEAKDLNGSFDIKVKLSRSGDAATAKGDLIGYYTTDKGVLANSKPVKVPLTEVAQ